MTHVQLLNMFDAIAHFGGVLSCVSSFEAAKSLPVYQSSKLRDCVCNFKSTADDIPTAIVQ